jgi:hypothetical protein
MQVFAGRWNSPQRAGSQWRRRGPGRRGLFLWWWEMWKACVYGLLVREGGRREGTGGTRLTCPIRIFKFLMSICRLFRDRPVEGQHVVFEATRSVNGLWGVRVEVESVDGC